MNNKLTTISKDFKNLSTLNKDIENLNVEIKNKLNILQNEYKQFQKQHKDSLHVFCLDSINFQLRLYYSYYENYMTTYNNINNHIYRDYYKLWKRLKHYVKNSVNSNKINVVFENSDFPFYDDTKINITYQLDVVKDLHTCIINVLLSLIKHSESFSDNISQQTILSNKGYDIKNLSDSLVFNNNVIESNVQLNIDLLEFYRNQQLKFLNEHHTKLTALYKTLPPIEYFRIQEDGNNNTDVSNNGTAPSDGNNPDDGTAPSDSNNPDDGNNLDDGNSPHDDNHPDDSNTPNDGNSPHEIPNINNLKTENNEKEEIKNHIEEIITEPPKKKRGRKPKQKIENNDQ